MKSQPDKYSELFILLTDAVNSFIKEVNLHNLSDLATEKWTVKDELCHVAYWHDYYHQNYAAVALGIKPFLFKSKGGSTRNQDGVDKLKSKSKKFLICLLEKSHKSLYESIVVKRVPSMTYIVGINYSTEKFLEIVTGHIHRHALQVKRAKNIHIQFGA